MGSPQKRRTPPRIRPASYSVHFIAQCAYCPDTIVRERNGTWQHLDTVAVADRACPTEAEPDDD